MQKFYIFHLPLWYFFLSSAAQEQPQKNVTSPPRRSGHSRDANLIAGLQQIQLQLNALEAESQRQNTVIQEVLRSNARLEGQRQELVSTMDRSEARLTQALDDVKSDVRKVITLQEVIRDDVEKIQQTQLLDRVWLEDQLRRQGGQNVPERVDISADPSSLLNVNADLLSNLQIVQTTLYGLRRMADTLQAGISTLRANLTDLTNLTRAVYDHTKNALVTKTYFQSSLQPLITAKDEGPQFIGCMMQNEEADERLPKDCKEVQELVENKTGIFRIKPKYATRPIFVYCDMETEGGGWTVIQRRRDGSIDFLREWNDYKYGFGNVGSEFWLGNENLYLITHQALYELRVDLHDFDDGHAYAKYDGFAVGSEKEKFMLKVLGRLSGGDAGDGMTYHASIPFSTTDMDNDRWEGGNCAEDHTGGWWYNQCDASNLNGQYLGGLTPQEYKGVYWHEWQGPNYSLMATQMMIRPMKHEIRVDESAIEIENASTQKEDAEFDAVTKQKEDGEFEKVTTEGLHP